MSQTISNLSQKVSDKVSDASTAVKDALTEKVLAPMGLTAPKKRTAYDAEAAEGTKEGRPSTNMAVCWSGPNKVVVKDVGYPKFVTPRGEPINHGVILKVIASNICGSDLHMYRGTMPGTKPGMVFGHEITGEIFEMGPDVERFDVGDIVSVPFNISCGKCDNCREMKTSACLKCNPMMPGAAYGFPLMGDWQGGQAEYVLVPYADFNLLKMPKEVAMDKILSLTFLSDIFPTGYNGAVQAGVGVGSIVYIAGAGPVGLCCARSCFLLGAAEVIISDQKADRLRLAEQIGCKTIDLTKLKGGVTDSAEIYAAIKAKLPSWQNGPHQLVDCSVDCVGYECCGVGKQAETQIDEQVLNTCFAVTKAGGGVGIPGIYPPADMGGPNSDNKQGVFHLRFGVCWQKALKLGMGQCPVVDFNVHLMKTIIHDKVDLQQLLNVKVISLEEAPAAYDRFNAGEAAKYVIDPHGLIRAHRAGQKA